MYKGKCNNTLAKSNSHTTADLVFPNIFCPAYTESINNSPLKQTLCDDNLDHSSEWLRHSAREQSLTMLVKVFL